MTTHRSRDRARDLKGGPYPSNEAFRKIAASTAHNVGSPWAFIAAVVVVLLWGVTGPVFHFSDTWQLVINTGTTIVTFLMVFLIQNTQNRDSYAIHLKLDELIRANTVARNALMAAEDLTDAELRELHLEFDRLARKKLAHRREKHGRAPMTESASERDGRGVGSDRARGSACGEAGDAEAPTVAREPARELVESDPDPRPADPPIRP